MTPTKIITYPFPLRGVEFLARLELPEDLTVQEARRLSDFIFTLAMDYEPDTTSFP